MTSNDRYAYAFWGDGTTTYIFRMDKNTGEILRAKTTDDHYSYFDLAKLPRRIIYQFRDICIHKWTDIPEFDEPNRVWELPENDDDTGITDQEFIDLFLARHRNVVFEDGRFKMLAEMQNHSKQYINVPNSMLRNFAKKNRYFGNAIWMVT